LGVALANALYYAEPIFAPVLDALSDIDDSAADG
jgi:hypothetical protein